MIVKATYIENWKELEENERLSLGHVEPRVKLTELGFNIKDVLYYKTFEDEGVVGVYFRNGKEEELEYSVELVNFLRKQFNEK